MKKVYVATKARGFLLNLFNNEFDSIEFINDKRIYETNSKKKLLVSKLVKSRIADHLGVIQRVRVKNVSTDVAFSYNRFLKSDTGYVIYLENPLALVHYSTGRNKTLLSKARLRRYLGDPMLRSIICLSKACYETVNQFYSIPTSVKVSQLYPLIKANKLTSQESIKEKCKKEVINCLFVSSNFKLKGGRDILLAFKKLKDLGVNNVKLRIITQLDSINASIQKEIEENENISISDFKFSKEDLNIVYNDSCILLNPTRQDSFSLVVLEAMKSGNAVLSTDLYAIPEMVEDGINGYLTNPKFRFFNYDNMPNEIVWNNRESTIYSDYTDNNIVDFLINKIMFLNENRDELVRMALNSFELSNGGDFNEKFIEEKWDKLLRDIN